MLMVMQDLKVRRSSMKGSLPNPLIFKKAEEAERGYLQTPPLTGAKSATSAQFKKVCLPSVEMPMTPASPFIGNEFEETGSTDEDAVSIQSTSSGSTAESEQTIRSPLKRSFEETDTETTPVAKRIMKEEDLIANPLYTLRQSGIPLSYIAANLLKVSPQFFNRSEAAVCQIRAIPMEAQPVRGLLRATIRSHSDSKATCRLGFAYRSKRTPLSLERIHAEDTCSSMPLHIEIALLRAPLLGRLLLSGHVFRHDMIEIELPYPEIFPDVMKWMYTDRMGKREKEIKECIDVLWGRY